MAAPIDIGSGPGSSVNVEISGIFISRGHDFRGHHGKPRGEHRVTALDAVECVAGKGLAGDRYFGFKDGYIGQITFIDFSVLQAIKRKFGRPDLCASVLRRNVVIEGADLQALISKPFRIGDVSFHGSEECAPCYWMDQAVGAGVEQFMKGRGGLRARITSSGVLNTGKHMLVVDPD